MFVFFAFFVHPFRRSVSLCVSHTRWLEEGMVSTEKKTWHFGINQRGNAPVAYFYQGQSSFTVSRLRLLSSIHTYM